MAKTHLETHLQEYNEGDIMNCGNYRGIRLMCRSMKIYVRECMRIHRETS